MGVGGRIFDDKGREITSKQAIQRARLGKRNIFVADPFPTVPKGLQGQVSVVAGGGVRPSKRFRQIDPVPVQDITSVRGLLNGKRRMDRNGQLRTGRTKRLSDEELRLLELRGLI